MWLRINKIIKSLKGIFEYLEHKDFKPNEIVFEFGDIGDNFYIILSNLIQKKLNKLEK